ncbi:MAG: hypothetical protein NTX06_09305, partial [Proteobacteria bacterium]|nr:hypothetical protein [Pseudomonadota bacterium]
MQGAFKWHEHAKLLLTGLEPETFIASFNKVVDQFVFANFILIAGVVRKQFCFLLFGALQGEVESNSAVGLYSSTSLREKPYSHNCQGISCTNFTQQPPKHRLTKARAHS